MRVSRGTTRYGRGRRASSGIVVSRMIDCEARTTAIPPTRIGRRPAMVFVPSPEVSVHAPTVVLVVE